MKRCKKLTKIQSDGLNKLISSADSSGKEVRRAQAILMLNDGGNSKTIVVVTKYQRRRIYELRKQYLKKGLVAILDKRKGSPKTVLTKKERKEIVKALQTKTPKDYGYNNEHWTTILLGHFIEKQYKIKYKSRTSYYLLFRGAKFTYHKPGRVYKNRSEKEVKEWKKTTEPIIGKAFEEKNTIILCEDEMVLSTQTTFQKIWLPQGDYPKIEVSNKKKAKSIFGFLNIKTGEEHAFKKEWQNMFITVEVLKELRKIYPTQKLLIVWDGAGWHRGSETQKFIKDDKNIETVYFPRYSPEENPQEHVWKKGRANVTNNKFIENIDKATDEFIAYLNSIKFTYSLLSFNAVS